MKYFLTFIDSKICCVIQYTSSNDAHFNGQTIVRLRYLTMFVRALLFGMLCSPTFYGNYL